MSQAGKISLPEITLPKGGGAIQGIGETFQANPFSGTGNLSIPLYTSPCRNIEPKLTLTYSSGSGNGIFGIGFSLSIPNISRKTEKGLPIYLDPDSDTFIISNAEDLVPKFKENGDRDERPEIINGEQYRVIRYRPRIEGLFAKIEFWVNISKRDDMYWKVTSKENITSIYGKNEITKIFDPSHPERIFTWLIEETFDAKGNRVIYEYKNEDEKNAPKELCEVNRSHTANKYIKQIRYGNYFDQNNIEQWVFEVVFDYGEHTDPDNPYDENPSGWLKRSDSFSSYKAGFEIRTYRLCRRVMMFHHFENEDCGKKCLVRATEFEYDETLILTYLKSVTQKGYRKNHYGAYDSESMPPLEFRYSSYDLKNQIFELLKLENDGEIPGIISQSGFQMVDLYGEGVPGILYTANESIRYWTNQGKGEFLKPQLIEQFPIHRNLARSELSLQDLGGDGKLDLIVQEPGNSGYYQANPDGSWELFRTFESYPDIDQNNSYTEKVDLTGDGFTDIMVVDDNNFTIYSSLGKKGYELFGQKVREHDRDALPDQNAGSRSEVLRYASIFGDGLQHRVRIQDGIVECWPNLGYGKFGKRVQLSNAPCFDGQLNPSRLFLADIDGSGTADIIYVYHDHIKVYLNQSGNSFSDPIMIYLPKRCDNLDQIQIADVLGNGASCLVISRNEPASCGQSHEYYDFTGGTKPHLIIEVRNNMGASTKTKYASSTKFYLEDKAAGKPWISRLAFPVHLIEKTETIDHISKTKLCTRYKYHHGFYDGKEREFRGFGCVEQWDTEEFDTFKQAGLFATEAFETLEKKLHVPPVHTKTWYHTGAYKEEGVLSRQFEDEYYKEDPDALLLADSVFDHTLANIDSNTLREAYRALKGQVLRQEVYAEDNKAGFSEHPYTVTESNCIVRLIQPKDSGNHPVFLVYPHESISYHYERTPTDPRIEHEFTLEVDEFGNVKRTTKVSYPRRTRNNGHIYDEQRQLKAITTLNQYINETSRFYMIGLPYESQSFEIGGSDLKGETYFTFKELSEQVDAALQTIIRFNQKLDSSQPQARLLSWERSYYWNKNQTYPLSLGTTTERGLLHHSESAVFSLNQVQEIFQGKVTRQMLEDEGGYREHDGYWWNPGITHTYYKEADKKFFLVCQAKDPLGNTTKVEYDAYCLTPLKVIDPLNNETVAEIDYHNIQPRKLTDLNNNVSEVKFDPLGLVVATSIHGQEDGVEKGDAPLENYNHIKPANLQNLIAQPHHFLQQATTYLFYNLLSFWQRGEPVHSMQVLREKHTSDLGVNEDSKVQFHIAYSDGLGRELQKKVKVEGGEAFLRVDSGELLRDESGVLIKGNVDERWLTSGRTVYNNKSKPVKQYEPFYSSTAYYEKEKELIEYGVTPILHYDPLLRVIRTDTPKGFHSKVEFSPWSERAWDENDTVKDSDYYGRYIDLDSNERAALDKARLHYDSPEESVLNNMGQRFVTIQKNTSDKRLYTYYELDIQGNELSITDPRQHVSNQARPLEEMVKNFEHIFDMKGFKLSTKSIDAGTTLHLNNAMEKVIHAWDSRGFHTITTYDELQRPTVIRVSGGGLDHTVEKFFYGSNSSTDKQKNLNGQIIVHFDQAGKETFVLYDISGNIRIAGRQLRKEYKDEVNWDSPEALEPGVFKTENRYDALDRLVITVNPDESRYEPEYHQSGWLKGVKVMFKDDDAPTTFVRDIGYNPKGQRERIEYGNDVVTIYKYEDETFRLIDLNTYSLRDNKQFQKIEYSYDPVGNITRIYDHSHKKVFTNQQEVQALCEYTYDALYRLTEATGREHPALAGDEYKAGEIKHTRFMPLNSMGSINNDQQLQNYIQRYTYDDAGNLTQIRHMASQSSRHWTRNMTVSDISNRAILQKPGITENPEDFFDENGNLLELDHLRGIEWNYRNNIASVTLIERPDGVSDSECYVYDNAGQRVRKVSERLINGDDVEVTEKIYLGNCEIKRIRVRSNAGETEIFKRKSLHVMDEKRRIALIHLWEKDDRKWETEDIDTRRIHYQFGNHLGSCSLELSEKAEVISYEEYFPYGGTSFITGKKKLDVSPKEYRYSGKERDDATGLYYYGVRYYAPWMGRWMNCDPEQSRSNLNLYNFVKGNPVAYLDPVGLSELPTTVEGWQQATESMFGKGEKNLRAEFIQEYVVNLTLSEYKKWNIAIEEEAYFIKHLIEAEITQLKVDKVIELSEASEERFIYYGVVSALDPTTLEKDRTLRRDIRDAVNAQKQQADYANIIANETFSMIRPRYEKKWEIQHERARQMYTGISPQNTTTQRATDVSGKKELFFPRGESDVYDALRDLTSGLGTKIYAEDIGDQSGAYSTSQNIITINKDLYEKFTRAKDPEYKRELLFDIRLTIAHELVHVLQTHQLLKQWGVK